MSTIEKFRKRAKIPTLSETGGSAAANLELLAQLPNFTPSLYHKNCPHDSASFHKFTLLPYDIRADIWRLCMPEPRVLNLHPYRNFRTARQKSHWCSCHTDGLPNNLPVTLSVSSESRAQTLRCGYRAFPSRGWYESPTIPERRIGPQDEERTFFSPLRDQVWLTIFDFTMYKVEPFRPETPQSGVLGPLVPACFDNLRCLELRYVDKGCLAITEGDTCAARHHCVKILSMFRDLEVLKVCVSNQIAREWLVSETWRIERSDPPQHRDEIDDFKMLMTMYLEWYCGGNPKNLKNSPKSTGSTKRKCPDCPQDESWKVPRIEFNFVDEPKYFTAILLYC